MYRAGHITQASDFNAEAASEHTPERAQLHPRYDDMTALTGRVACEAQHSPPGYRGPLMGRELSYNQTV